MVFYVNVVAFLVTLFMNKFTSTTIPTYFLFIQMSFIETKFDNIKGGDNFKVEF